MRCCKNFSSLSKAALYLRLSDCQYRIKIVLQLGLIPLLQPAKLTAMQDPVGARASGNSDRLHHPAALSQTITGLNVHMFAPQTARTVVGVAITLHLKVAMLADKILDLALKFFSQG
jgi:hypothetical protein